MTNEYIVVFMSESSLKLSTSAAGQPMAWNFDFSPGRRMKATIWDVVDDVGGVALHRGLKFLVALTAESIDLAIEEALLEAETLLTATAAAGRAAVLAPDPVLAFQFTGPTPVRDHRQWEYHLGHFEPKATVSRSALEAILPRLYEVASPEDVSRLWRVRQSMKWHRIALFDFDPLHRFLHLWLGIEALEPSLADHLDVPRGNGFPGFRKLEETLGREPVFADALKNRRALFHVIRDRWEVIGETAARVLPGLEDLLIAAWYELLGAERPPDSLLSSVWPVPQRLELDSVLVQDDTNPWSDFSQHPHWEGGIELSRLPDSSPGRMSFEVCGHYRVRNAANWKDFTYRMKGAGGPFGDMAVASHRSWATLDPTGGSEAKTAHFRVVLEST